MNAINYLENYEKESYLDLIQSSENGTDQQANLLDLNMGMGNIRVIQIEPGLQLRIWDCIFTNGIGILRQAHNETPQRRSFTLMYFMTPDSFVLEECQHSPAVINEVWNTVLMSSDAKFRVQLLPAKPLRCVSINFSAGWLQKNVLPDIKLHPVLMQSLTYDADPFVQFESLSMVERRVNDGLFEHINQKEFGKFFWRSRVLNLLTAFFLRISDRRSMQDDGTVSHEEKIASVQKQLVDNIYKGLPDIGTMAKQAAVSESMLKRYFRKVYGENIYSYYQEKRMICAKRLLMEKNKTVTETASIMGYGSVSSFNNTFKRFFGLKPDKFQRINMVAVDI
jgi:AraC-like DNA-binding protein